MKNKIAAWIVLGLIAVIAAVCLSATNEVTKGVIEQQAIQAAEEARLALVPGADRFELNVREGQAVDTCYTGMANGQAVGYVAQMTVQGFGGPVEITVGTDTEGTISGIRVGGSAFAETAGLGAKAKDAAFTDQFAGLVAPVSLGAEAEQVDAITAATITSSAVVRGVNDAIKDIAAVAGFEVEAAQGEVPLDLGNGRYAAVKAGFAGPVYVEVQLDDAGTITEIVIGDDRFSETNGYGSKALEPAFKDQFIGKSGEVKLGEDVDAISGATITSKAVEGAVNLALLFARDPEAALAEATPKKFVLPEVPADARTAKSSKKGFGGPVAATITVDAEGTQLLRVEFGDENWAETEGFGSKIKDGAFWQPLICQALPLDADKVDMVAGATVSSKAAVEAINKAYYSLFPERAPAEPTAPPAPVVEETSANTASASKKGYAGPVAAKLTIDENNRIAAVKFGDDTFAETQGFGSRVLDEEFAAQFIGKPLPLQAGDVELLAGATITSQAAFDAVNKAYDKITQSGAGAASTPAEAVTASAQGDANSASASKKGYTGPVAAEITIDENNRIVSVKFGDESFAETEGVGTRVLEDAFAAQFVGKKLPLQAGDVELLAGATVTSQAAFDAVNKAFDKIAQSGQVTVIGGADGPTAILVAHTNTASASKKGYTGPVAAEIAIDENNRIVSVKFGDESFAETEGVGTRVLEDAFAAQFVSKKLPLQAGDVELLAGATVTSQAAFDAVNKAYEKIIESRGAQTPVTQTASASKKGYAGPVAAEITIDENNQIVSVEFGDESFVETEGVGTRVLEDAFAAQFVGKKLPLQAGDVELLAGATVTSQAAFDAVNKAYEKIAQPTADMASAAPVGGAKTATASSKGYGGPVGVTLTVDESGKITEIRFGDENFAETEGFGSKVLEDSFAAQFIGKSGTVALTDIDVIAGATVSTEAAVNAVNKALSKLAGQ